MKKNKSMRLAVWLLTLCLLTGACSAPQNAQTQPAEAETTAAETEPETEETEPAPTEPPYREASEIKIGMVFYGEENDGSVLTAALRRGLTAAAADLGIGEEQILWQYNSREADWTQIEDSILACVDAGCQLVFGGAREYGAVIAAIAEEYPDVMFACVDSELYNGKNSGTYEISLAAAQYLSGVAAAALSQTGHIGFLAAKGASDTEVTDAVNAFAYGVWSVNPQAVVEVGVTGKWFLPEAEAAAAVWLRDLGCDVMGGYTDCSAGLRAAADMGMQTLGCGAEDAGLYGDAYDSLSAGAVLYRFEPYFSMKLNQAIQKTVAGEAWTGDYYDGAAEFRGRGEISQEALLQLASWRPLSEEETTSVPEDDGLWEEAETGESAGDEPGTELGEPAGDEPETETGEPAGDGPETELEEPAGDEPEAETGEPAGDEPETEEISAITRDEDTGYLTNVRIHEIQIPEETEEE